MTDELDHDLQLWMLMHAPAQPVCPEEPWPTTKRHHPKRID
jgi:hypothetical protein